MKKFGIFVILFVFGLSGLKAQSSKVTAAWSKMDNYIMFGMQDVTDLVKARDLIDEAVENEKSKISPKAHLYRGKIYQLLSAREEAEYAKGANDQAFAAFKEVMALEDAAGKKKKHSKEAMDGILALAPAFYNQGSDCYTSQDFDCAYLSFNNVVTISELAIEKDIKNATIDTAALLAAAYSADKSAKSDEAVSMYKRLIELDYDDASVYLGAARILKDGGDVEESNKMIQQGLDRFPDDKALNIEKVNMLLSGGNQDEAIKSMEEAISVDDSNPSLHFALGVAYDSQQNYDKAISSYSKAIKLDPAYFNAFYNLGAVYYNQAAAKSKEMNDLPIDDQANYDRLKKETEDLFGQALPFLEKAHELNAEDKGTLLALKEIYARTNQLEKMSEMKKKFDALK